MKDDYHETYLLSAVSYNCACKVKTDVTIQSSHTVISGLRKETKKYFENSNKLYSPITAFSPPALSEVMKPNTRLVDLPVLQQFPSLQSLLSTPVQMNCKWTGILLRPSSRKHLSTVHYVANNCTQ